MKLIFLTILMSLSQLSCQRRLAVQNSEWHQEGGTKPPSVPNFQYNDQQEFNSLGQTVIFRQQSIFDVPVENLYSKSIFQKDNAAFISYNILTKESMNLKADLFFMKRSGDSCKKTILSVYPEFANLVVYKSQLMVGIKEKAFAFWRFYFEKHDGSLIAVDIDSKHKIQNVSFAGSHLSEPKAFLYPKGPISSQLETVNLIQLLDPTTLVSDFIKVSTKSPFPAVAPDSQFLFPTDDSRFYQVQAYHYSSQALRWIGEKFQFYPTHQITIETSLGFPDKTNTAFYFDDKIRLGDGDDIVFSKIPLDPSIVTHESIHSIIDIVAQLPFDSEGGSINEGFADFFTACILKNPLLGEVSYKKAPFKRTVNNDLKFSDINGGLYHDSGIISGLFWKIKTVIDEDTATSLAWNSLLRATPKTRFSSFKETVLALTTSLPEAKKVQVQKILKERGWVD